VAVPVFNALEILSAQAHLADWPLFGKLLNLFTPAVKRLADSHSDGEALRVLIISDLLHRNIDPGKSASKVNTDRTVALLRNVDALPEELRNQITFAVDKLVTARFLHEFNDACEPNVGNLDLEYLYRILEGSDHAQESWYIERTAYVAPPSDAKVEEVTALDRKRVSLVWDANRPFPGVGMWDLILMRRGLCYCNPTRACCGLACDENAVAGFLKRISLLLKNNDKSAAYLGGWNTPDKGAVLNKACAVASMSGLDSVFEVVWTELKKDETAGVFVSRGRQFPRDCTFKMPDGWHK
jgi:hypothetical protein